MQSNNPLTPFFRVPKLYVKLPSEYRYYNAQDIQLSVNGEVAVYPLTALDQLLLRTPDAMLNGESLLKVMKNCVPDIQDPKVLVEPDINMLLLAIKVATSGPNMSLDLPCPSCNHTNEYQIDLNSLLETATPTPHNDHIEYNDTLLIHVRPYNFNQRNLTLLNEITYSNAVKMIQENADTTDPKKIEQASQSVDLMSRRTFNIIAQSITAITIVSSGERVTQTEFINEFLSGITKDQSDVIINMIKDLNQSGVDTNHAFQCVSCNHEWRQSIDFDPISFFA